MASGSIQSKECYAGQLVSALIMKSTEKERSIQEALTRWRRSRGKEAGRVHMTSGMRAARTVSDLSQRARFAAWREKGGEPCRCPLYHPQVWS